MPVEWELTHKGGHYPFWIGLHELRCTEAHDHRAGTCCANECWCQQEPLKVLGSGSGCGLPGTPNYRPPTISHMRHPRCTLRGWHPTDVCGAMVDADGNRRPVLTAHLKGPGDRYSIGAPVRPPKEEGYRRGDT